MQKEHKVVMDSRLFYQIIGSKQRLPIFLSEEEQRKLNISPKMKVHSIKLTLEDGKIELGLIPKEDK